MFACTPVLASASARLPKMHQLCQTHSHSAATASSISLLLLLLLQSSCCLTVTWSSGTDSFARGWVGSSMLLHGSTLNSSKMPSYKKHCRKP
jgi:hypothetical protein